MNTRPLLPFWPGNKAKANSIIDSLQLEVCMGYIHEWQLSKRILLTKKIEAS